MPAWIYVIAVAAVLTVAWYGFARRWWHALRYSMRRASHAYAEVEDDYGSAPAFYGSAPLQGSMTLTEEIAYWNSDWRERTRVELAPETLDLLAAPMPDEVTEILRGMPPLADQLRDLVLQGRKKGLAVDPGPGGEGSSSSPSPGPDHQYGSEAELVAELERQGWFDPERSPAREQSPDWLEAQMAEVYGWVRGMVPQVTGWSVGA